MYARRSDVGLVDAHAEGVRGGNDLDPPLHERLLSLPPFLGEHGGVIDRRGPARVLGDEFGHLLRRLRVEA